MKNTIFACLLVVILTSVIGCKDASSGSDENGGTQSVLYARLGKVNKVYSALNSARFYTGQIIDGKRFEGNIVEYNSLKQALLDYVESLESNNALMHQRYESIVYDATKKYVEFSTYTDIETEEIVEVEVRIFFGNFLETYETDYWYAKSVRFNKDLTKDLNTNQPVSF